MIKISQHRFLLILATGAGFWQDMHHVLGQLLAAELTFRIPIVFWSKNSLYGIPEAENAFEYFFLPVSGYTVQDLSAPQLSWYPPIMNFQNTSSCRLESSTEQWHELSKLKDCKADVLVHCKDIGIEEPMQWLTPSHLLYGLCEKELYCATLQKYIKLQPVIQTQIDQFYQEHMAGTPLIAVHIRGSDKVLEVPHLHALNKKYPVAIDGFLRASPSARIFLMTDCFDILSEYQERYGDLVIHTDCKRVLKCDEGVHYKHYSDKKRKGLEIIKDTWLASKCDYFIGNGYSNVSRAISELKQWPDACTQLLL